MAILKGEYMMSSAELYRLWLSENLSDTDLTQELLAIQGKDDEINDRFYRQLEFGTAGLRGVIGAGTNRMNIYTVGCATQGLANYLQETVDCPSVAIAYDSRIKSDLFAKVAAEVLAANGVKVYIYSELMPTPMLSFAVRRLECNAGIVVTASHNPAKYNGYKAYGPDGCQMTEESADAVYAKITELDIFSDVDRIPFEEGLERGIIEYISQDVIDEYIECVKKQSCNPYIAAKAGLKVVYTPLNGTGNKPVRRILSAIGVDDVTIVEEQEMPDGNFTTCSFPNPEIKETLDLGLKKAKEIGADLLIATDPDADRVGIAIKTEKDYRLVTGNEVGALLMSYICESRTAAGTMPRSPVAVKSFVTTQLAADIGKEYGVEVIDVLTGFKYIGETIGRLEAEGEEDRFILGFEESYGYLSGTYVRDKDAVVGSMLICEMAAYYKDQGVSLVSKLEGLYRKYGRYLHTQQSFTCEGEQGMELMSSIMQGLRDNPPKNFGGMKVERYSDYKASQTIDYASGNRSAIMLPKANALAYDLDSGCSVIIRPSGTEPKIKVYYTMKAKTLEAAQKMEKELRDCVGKILGM